MCNFPISSRKNSITFPAKKKTNGDFCGVSRVLYRWTWAVMFQSPVLNSAAKVALIRLFASWQHLSALEEGCQTALEHFQSSLSQQMELQTICGQTTGPPVVPHCGSYFVTLSNIVGLMFYFFFFSQFPMFSFRDPSSNYLWHQHSFKGN